MIICPICGGDINKCSCYASSKSGSGCCGSSSGCGGGGCSGGSCGSSGKCSCTRWSTCSNCSSKKNCHDKSDKKDDLDGVFCRACGEFNEYAEPDKVVDDGKNTCYNCRNHPERRKKGLPQELKDRIREIFPIK